MALALLGIRPAEALSQPRRLFTEAQPYSVGMTPALEPAPPGEAALLEAVEPLRAKLARHPLYSSIRSVAALRLFMESHVYAVWDFMSLVKALQRELTCIAVPWRPARNAAACRLINEIVLGEESDLYQGEALSHFELYMRAMESCGGRRAGADRLVAAIEGGAPVERALGEAGVPEEARQFVRATFAVLATEAPHRVAAAFAFGREDLIPEMFSSFVRELDEGMPGRVAPFRYYLERHIAVDGDEHGPMALAMLRELCPTARHWAEARESAEAALKARIALWDGIHVRIELGESACGEA